MKKGFLLIFVMFFIWPIMVWSKEFTLKYRDTRSGKIMLQDERGDRMQNSRNITQSNPISMGHMAWMPMKTIAPKEFVDGLLIPGTIYGVVGDELTINTCALTAPYGTTYQWDFSAIGTQTASTWTYTPSEAGSHQLTVSAYTLEGIEVYSKDITISIENASTSGLSFPRVMIIGDSQCGASNEFVRDDIAALDLADPSLDITWVGSLTGDTECYAGQKIERFYNSQYLDPPINTVDNPFINGTGYFDLTHYLSEQSETAPNFFIFHLGVNAFFNLTTDLAVKTAAVNDITYYTYIINNILDVNPNAYIGICIEGPPHSDQSKFTSFANPAWKHRRHWYLYNQTIRDHKWSTVSDRISVIGTNIGCDPAGNYDHVHYDGGVNAGHVANAIWWWMKDRADNYVAVAPEEYQFFWQTTACSGAIDENGFEVTTTCNGATFTDGIVDLADEADHVNIPLSSVNASRKGSICWIYYDDGIISNEKLIGPSNKNNVSVQFAATNRLYVDIYDSYGAGVFHQIYFLSGKHQLNNGDEICVCWDDSTAFAPDTSGTPNRYHMGVKINSNSFLSPFGATRADQAWSENQMSWAAETMVLGANGTAGKQGAQFKNIWIFDDPAKFPKSFGW